MTTDPNKPAPAAPARPTEAEFVAALNSVLTNCVIEAGSADEARARVEKLVVLFRRARGDEGAMAERDLAREQLDAAIRRAEAAEAIIKQHDLCHNLQGKVDAQSFADGCAEFQRKLYGCAPDADALAALRAERDALAAQIAEMAPLEADEIELRDLRKRLFNTSNDLSVARQKLATYQREDATAWAAWRKAQEDYQEQSDELREVRAELARLDAPQPAVPAASDAMDAGEVELMQSWIDLKIRSAYDNDRILAILVKESLARRAAARGRP